MGKRGGKRDREIETEREERDREREKNRKHTFRKATKLSRPQMEESGIKKSQVLRRGEEYCLYLNCYQIRKW